MIKRAIVFCFLLAVMLGCANEPDCDQTILHSTINVVFYDIENVEDSVKIRFNEVGAIGTDQTFYNSLDSLAKFTLELNPSDTVVTYFFRTALTRDTVVLSYSREMRWLSDECGPHINFNDLFLESSTFDSTVLASPQIDNSVNESIRIYN